MFSSAAVAKVIDECEAMIATKDDAWSIDRPSAIFLYQIALLRGAKHILEIGMSYGHSGLYLADAAMRNGGKLTTVEANEKKVPIARDYFACAGLSKAVTILEGRAPEILREVGGGIDLLFVDATKAEQQAYLDILWPKLDGRAVIVTDNVTSHPKEMVEYLAKLRGDGKLVSGLVPIGHGMELTLRVG